MCMAWPGLAIAYRMYTYIIILEICTYLAKFYIPNTSKHASTHTHARALIEIIGGVKKVPQNSF